MKVYQISYDLRKQRDYAALFKRIKAYPNWCHALESTWVITSQNPAKEIRDHLAGAMDNDDGLLVTRLHGEAAWINLVDDISRWLKNQLTSSTV